MMIKLAIECRSEPQSFSSISGSSSSFGNHFAVLPRSSDTGLAVGGRKPRMEIMLCTQSGKQLAQLEKDYRKEEPCANGARWVNVEGWWVVN